jgi:multicomponent Na+:H+ antiporter subunit E
MSGSAKTISAGPNPQSPVGLRVLVIRATLFALLWWVLTDGAVDSWVIGAPAVLVAAWTSAWLLPAASWSWFGFARFLPLFLWYSLLGAIDVARLALHPRMTLSPELFEHQFGLPSQSARVFLANVASLLPGTLSTEMTDKSLCLHALDPADNIHRELVILERAVARVFRVELNHSDHQAV